MPEIGEPGKALNTRLPAAQGFDELDIGGAGFPLKRAHAQKGR